MKSKNIFILFVILFTCITSACNAPLKEETNWKDSASVARSQFQTYQSGYGVCQVSADYGERVYDFSLDTSFTREEDGLKLEYLLTAPELLTGIKVTDFSSSSQLIWDDLILETGNLAEISPITAYSHLVTQLEEGYLESGRIIDKSTTNGMISVLELHLGEPDLEKSQGIETILWLNFQDLTLLGGEIYENGTRVLTCALQDFVYQ